MSGRTSSSAAVRFQSSSRVSPTEEPAGRNYGAAAARHRFGSRPRASPAPAVSEEPAPVVPSSPRGGSDELPPATPSPSSAPGAPSSPPARPPRPPRSTRAAPAPAARLGSGRPGPANHPAPPSRRLGALARAVDGPPSGGACAAGRGAKRGRPRVGRVLGGRRPGLVPRRRGAGRDPRRRSFFIAPTTGSISPTIVAAADRSCYCCSALLCSLLEIK